MRRRDSRQGFTLLELLVILAIVMVVATLGYVGFEQMMVRTRLQGDAVGISNALQRARALAVRRSAIVVAEVNFGPTDELVFYYDDDDDQTWDLADEEEAQPPLKLTSTGRPETSVYFWAADSDAPDPVAAMDGLTTRAGTSAVVVIEADGSVRDTGGIRIGMGPWPRVGIAKEDDFQRNFMEVRIVIGATGRTELRKFIPDYGSDPEYQPRLTSADGSPNWKFYTG